MEQGVLDEEVALEEDVQLKYTLGVCAAEGPKLCG